MVGEPAYSRTRRRISKSSHASPLKIGDNNVWIRNTWHHSGYLLDSLGRKESVVGTNLRPEDKPANCELVNLFQPGSLFLGYSKGDPGLSPFLRFSSEEQELERVC